VSIDTQSPSALPTGDVTWRERAYPAALLAGLAIALVVLAAAADRSAAPAATVGGDFPAFYGAARIAAAGDWDELYDFDRQVAAQSGLHTRDATARYFAYPPQVAFVHRPLAALGYGSAYLVYTAAMLLALVAAIRLAQPMLPWLKGRTWLATAIALSFWPMMRAVTGGSNTALSLLVMVGAWRLIEKDRHIEAGLVLSLLLAKPQLAVPLIGLMLVIGLRRVVLGAAAGTGLFYLLGVPLAGWRWPLEWWDVASTFGRIDTEVNGYSSVSWLGFLENAIGIGSRPAVVAGWVLATVTSLGLVWLWRRHGVGRLPALLAVAMPVILLLSPHALSHDTALVLLSIAVLHNAGRVPRGFLAVVWLLGVSQAWIRSIGFSPGFFLLLLVGWWAFANLDLSSHRRKAAASYRR